MAKWKIAIARPEHCRWLAPNLREEEKHELMLAGQTPLEGLEYSLGWSLIAKTVFVNGRIAMMFGLAGEVTEDQGVAWCLTTEDMAKIPFSFAREARRELAIWLQIKKKIYAYVGKDYDCANRFWKLMGFSVDNAQTLWINDFQLLSIGRK